MAYCYKCMREKQNRDFCQYCRNSSSVKMLSYQLSPGSMLHDKYLVGQVLGQGGFGITYIGRDLILDRRVAIKEFYPSEYVSRNTAYSTHVSARKSRDGSTFQDGVQRFLAEAQSLARFQDVPGIVKVLDYFEDNSTAYIVMEYLEGHTLKELSESRSFTSDEVFQLLRPVIHALKIIHSENVIHRDISPDNIMVLENESAVLMDFGASYDAHKQYKNTSVVLKEGYAPPEQYYAEGDVGPWSDIYALCSTIYTTITKKTLPNSIDRTTGSYGPKLNGYKYPLTKSQERVLKKGLEINRKDRYQSIEELERDLDVKQGHRGKETSDHEAYKKVATWVMIIALLAVSALTYVQRYHEKEDPVFDGNTHMLLSMDERTTVDNYNNNMEKLTDRLDLMIGSEYYTINELENRRIELDVAADQLGDADVEAFIRYYLTSAGKMYFYTGSRKEAVQEPMLIKPEYLEETVIHQGSIPGDGDKYDGGYLELRLSEEGIKECWETIENQGENLAVIKDVYSGSDRITNDRSRYYHTVISEKEKTVYISDPDPSLQFPTLLSSLQYFFGHEALDENIDYSIEYPVDWEESAKKDRGIKQVKMRSLNEDSLDLIFREAPEEAMTDGEWLDLQTALKSRLDALGEKYSVGFIRDSKEKNIVIKTSYDHMGLPIIRSLTDPTYTFAVQIGNLRATFIPDKDKMTIRECKNDRYELCLEFQDTETIKQIQRACDASEGNLASFLLGADSEYGFPILSEPLETVMEGDTLRFRWCYTDERKTISEEERWILEYIQALNDSSGSIHNRVDVTVGNGSYSNSDLIRFGVTTRKEENEVLDYVLSLADPAEVYTSPLVDKDPGILYISLYLNVDDQLPETGLQIARDIYEHVSLDSSVFHAIEIYLIDENDRWNNGDIARARIRFDQNVAPLYAESSDEPRDSVSGTFSLGILPRYKEQFEEMIQTSDFYSLLSDNYMKYLSEDGVSGWDYGD